ncbi:Uncharacterized protein QTN25_005894 [Entamoeba marina]
MLSIVIILVINVCGTNQCKYSNTIEINKIPFVSQKISNEDLYDNYYNDSNGIIKNKKGVLYKILLNTSAIISLSSTNSNMRCGMNIISFNDCQITSIDFILDQNNVNHSSLPKTTMFVEANTPTYILISLTSNNSNVFVIFSINEYTQAIAFKNDYKEVQSSFNGNDMLFNEKFQPIPTSCEQSISITTFPFSITTSLNTSLHKTQNICNETELSYPAVFFKVKGIGAPIIFHTCNSISGSSEIEIIGSCENINCVEKASIYCGLHSYIEFNAETNKDYYIRVFCIHSPCDINFNAEYSSTSNHDICQNSLTVTSTIQEAVLVSSLQDSQHGCDGEILIGKGKWYKFLGTDTLITSNGHHIFSHDEKGNYINHIEIHRGCEYYYCVNNNLTQDVIIDSTTTYMVFVLSGESEWLIITITNEELSEHDSCDFSKEVTLPFNLLNWNENATTSKNFCSEDDELKGIWYKFNVSLKSIVYISTCSDPFINDLNLVIGSGSCDLLTCLINTHNATNCNDDKYVNFEAIDTMKYYILVGSSSINSNYQFSISAHTSETPDNSKCNSAFVIPLDQTFIKFTTFNQYAYISNITLPNETTSNEFKGTYLFINSGYYGEMTITTCSTGTEIPSFISIHDSCETNIDSNISFPSTPIDISFYPSNTCNEYGSILTIQLNYPSPKFIFVGGSFIDYPGFIDIEILISATSIDQSSNADNQSSEQNDDDVFDKVVLSLWIVYGICCFIIFILDISIVTVLIIIRKREIKNISYSKIIV